MTDSLGRPRCALFTGTAWHYARYRPGYPEAFLADLVARFRLDGTGRLLDVGCGTGQLTIPLAEHVSSAIGMDPVPEMLFEAATRAQAGHVTNVTWAQGSSVDLPGEFGRFRLVTMGRSFHWMDRERVLTALAGMVDADGGLVIANDSCLVRPTTAWQQAIEDLQHRFLPRDWQADSPSLSNAHESHEEILARSLFRGVHRLVYEFTRVGRSNRPSAISTRPHCHFARCSATGGRLLKKKSRTHCSRSTRVAGSPNPSPWKC